MGRGRDRALLLAHLAAVLSGSQRGSRAPGCPACLGRGQPMKKRGWVCPTRAPTAAASVLPRKKEGGAPEVLPVKPTSSSPCEWQAAPARARARPTPRYVGGPQPFNQRAQRTEGVRGWGSAPRAVPLPPAATPPSHQLVAWTQATPTPPHPPTPPPYPFSSPPLISPP